MLSKNYRFQAVNKSGVTVANIDVYVERSKFDSNGALSFKSGDPTQIITATSVANNAVSNSADQDNSTDLMLKLDGHFRVNITGTPGSNAHVDLYVQYVRTTTPPSNERGTLVASIEFAAAKDETVPFSWFGE